MDSGYHVTPAEADAPELPAPLLHERIDDVQGTVDDLGELETWMLELCATIHFVDQLDDGAFSGRGNRNCQSSETKVLQ